MAFSPPSNSTKWDGKQFWKSAPLGNECLLQTPGRRELKTGRKTHKASVCLAFWFVIFFQHFLIGADSQERFKIKAA